jgi:hypothetical protein
VVEGLSFPVSSTRLSAPRSLRDDEVCEILTAADKALQAAGEWRTHVRWDAEPPVLYVAKMPVMVSLGL